MKRIMSLLIVLFMVVSFVLLISTVNNTTQEVKEVLEPVLLSDITYELENPKVAKVTSQNYMFIQEMQRKMFQIKSIEDKREWFIAYKEIVSEYENILDPPETIYDYFNEEELDLLFRVVQAEVGDEWEFIHKANVANVIFNRLYSESRDFKDCDSLSEVLVADQFCTVRNGNYKKVEVSDVTILACEYAFMIEDTTNGALFFDNNGSLNYEFINNDGAHNFYKIKEEN